MQIIVKQLRVGMGIPLCLEPACSQQVPFILRLVSWFCSVAGYWSYVKYHFCCWALGRVYFWLAILFILTSRPSVPVEIFRAVKFQTVWANGGNTNHSLKTNETGAPDPFLSPRIPAPSQK